MFSLALKYDVISLRGPHEDCDEIAVSTMEIMGLLFHVCQALHENGGVRFEVIAFADEPWPVSVRRDLSVALEQISDLLAAVRSPAVAEFELSFYEQGIERDLLFTRDPSGRLVIDLSTQLDWNPARTVENIDAHLLEQQLVKLVEDFVRAAKVVCPAAMQTETLREWLDGMSMSYLYD